MVPYGREDLINFITGSVLPVCQKMVYPIHFHAFTQSPLMERLYNKSLGTGTPQTGTVGTVPMYVKLQNFPSDLQSPM
jgi:hypothetical protein